MPRHPRVEYPGAIYNMMSRGGAIYRDDVGRQDFLKTLAEEPNANLKAKVELAYRLRRETTLTMRQIAERLSMGSWKSLDNKLYLLGKERKKK